MANKVDPMLSVIAWLREATFRVNERPAIGEIVAPIEEPSITEFVVKELVTID